MNTDVLILGGGLVGLTTAIALDRHGISSIVVDPAEPQTQLSANFDGRVSAIASAPWAMFGALGLTDAMRPEACPIRRIEVRDGLQKDCLDFTPKPHDAGDLSFVGMMLENRVLRQVLHGAVDTTPHLTFKPLTRATNVTRDEAGVRATLSDGTQIKARLLIGAEGRQSPTRDEAGIRSARWRYRHDAIVTAVHHSLPHHNI
ncbi:MAG: FAD-dependent monooxygenase, partial [Alphaproteobacteria bacterium]|nr:FAD-dependent monooxygenase [Alphaproteobacteria bacterium]